MLSIFVDSLLLTLCTQSHSPYAPHFSFMPCLLLHMHTLPSHIRVWPHVSAHKLMHTQIHSNRGIHSIKARNLLSMFPNEVTEFGFLYLFLCSFCSISYQIPLRLSSKHFSRCSKRSSGHRRVYRMLNGILLLFRKNFTQVKIGSSFLVNFTV